jgi:hypothetical protein
MDLSTKAMLAAIHISLWTARKHDRKVSREVATLNGANEQAGRYNKRLFCEAPKLDEIQTIAGRIRQYFYRVTLPWSDEGLRILPAELYFEFNAQMRDFAAEFRYAVDEFLDAYDTYVKEAQPMLGSLFRLKDYPSGDKVKEKFALRPEILPIPTGDDFRVSLSEDEQARIARDIDASTRAAIGDGMRDLWTRLYEVTHHMASRLADPEARFHGTLVSNVCDLVELLPRLNIVGDPHLASLTEQVRKQLCQHSADLLRNSPTTRQQTAASAAAIACTIASVLAIDQTPTEPPQADEAGAESLFEAVARSEQSTENETDAILDHMAAYMGAPV